MTINNDLTRDEFYRLCDEAVEQENFDLINSIPGVTISISSDKPCSHCYIGNTNHCKDCQQYEDWQNNN